MSKLDDIKYDESINSEYIEVLNQFKNFKHNKKKIFDDNKYDNYFLVLSNNLKLDFYLNHDNGKLVYAFHNSKKVDNKSVILDLLCDQIINKSINEVADHGVIYLEYYLRSKIKKAELWNFSSKKLRRYI